MPQLLIASSLWLHALATVVFIGYYVVLALICVPALQGTAPRIRSEVICLIARRSRTWLYVSLLVFAVTGAYLTLADPSYLGLGNFGNPWAMLMLAKHILILGMVAFDFWSRAPSRLIHFRRYVKSMAIAGAAVLLLTAAAQDF